MFTSILASLFLLRIANKSHFYAPRLLEFCNEKELCVANTWLEKKAQRKIIQSIGGNEI